MSSNAILSIITVVKNDALRLSATLDSLKGYYDSNLIEHIIIDSKSTDETINVLKKISHFKNVTILSECDDGIYDGMNKGISLSSGLYLLFLNCGDEMVVDSSMILSFLKNWIEADIICFPCQLSDGKKIYHLTPNLGVKHKTPTSHQAMIFSKSFIKNNLYNTNYRLAADYDIFLSAKCDRIYCSTCLIPITSIQLIGYSSENPILAYWEYLLIASRRLSGYSRVMTLVRISFKAFVVISFKLIFPRNKFYLVRNFFR